METNFNYIHRNLMDGKYPYIGTGSSRMVYDLDNGYVAKLAKNEKGFAQNMTEYRIYLDARYHLFAPIIDVSYDYKILIMQKGEKMQSYHDLFRYFEVTSFRELLRLDSLQWIVLRYHLIEADLRRMSSWGVLYERPVLIDYGYTNEVMQTYYQKQ